MLKATVTTTNANDSSHGKNLGFSHFYFSNQGHKISFSGLKFTISFLGNDQN